MLLLYDVYTYTHVCVWIGGRGRAGASRRGNMVSLCYISLYKEEGTGQSPSRGRRRIFTLHM